MDLVNILRNKKASVNEILECGIFLRKQWEDKFASHLSLKDKEDIYLWDKNRFCGYLWHLFSYEKRECQQGKEAEKVFNNESKDDCYIFWQHKDYALVLQNTDMLNSNDLVDEQDIYAADKEINWIYVNTHESGLCRPYFRKGHYIL